MNRRHFLVTYDISDDKRRDKVFKALHGFGNHIQYSVFLCELDDRELARLRARLAGEVHSGEDQVLVLDLGRAIHPLDSIVEAIGRALDLHPRALVV